ncbi:cytosolic protein [Apibacter muscae]|uniref:EndoU domain-containing protein n=1 Tax=Apibacter muscae TaxID=2509004 RepID=UPI0011AC5C9C|nr:cytosolic protein [Apibacter muscae]
MDEFSNGVRRGNGKGHENKIKRNGTAQSWFPEGWTPSDIEAAGNHVINNTPNFGSIPDGQPVYGTYKGVRVGVIKTNGKVATIFPDGNIQPPPLPNSPPILPNKDNLNDKKNRNRKYTK